MRREHFPATARRSRRATSARPSGCSRRSSTERPGPRLVRQEGRCGPQGGRRRHRQQPAGSSCRANLRTRSSTFATPSASRGAERAYIRCHPTRAMFPRHAQAGTSAFFVNENAALTAPSSTVDGVELVAKKLAAIVTLSSELRRGLDARQQGRLRGQRARVGLREQRGRLRLQRRRDLAYGGMRGVAQNVIDGNHGKAKVTAASGHNTFLTLDATDLAARLIGWRSAPRRFHARPGSSARRASPRRSADRQRHRRLSRHRGRRRRHDAASISASPSSSPRHSRWSRRPSRARRCWPSATCTPPPCSASAAA